MASFRSLGPRVFAQVIFLDILSLSDPGKRCGARHLKEEKKMKERNERGGNEANKNGGGGGGERV